MPDKKKQHFVPRFYLKNFSLNSSGRTIGIFNLSSAKFIPSGSLKDQAYKDYFYGRDATIEDAFCELEGVAAKIIQNILAQHSTPLSGSKEHYALLTFIIFLSARTVYRVDELNEAVDKFIKAVLSKDLSISPYLDKGRFSLTQPTHMALSEAALCLPLTFDLCFKLVINKTKEPFITSDHPVVLYNQFLEPRKKYGNNTGLACKGQEIFLPLSPRHLIIFFDRDIYKVGNKSEKSIEVATDSDVRALNLIQCISADKNLYFNEEISEIHIRQLVNQSEQQRRKTRANIDEFMGTNNEEERRLLVHMYTSDIRCSLSLSFIHILKKAKQYALGDRVIHVRNEEICCLHERFVELVKQGKYRAREFPEFLRDVTSAV